jgi:hypothetical protein
LGIAGLFLIPAASLQLRVGLLVVDSARYQQQRFAAGGIGRDIVFRLLAFLLLWLAFQAVTTMKHLPERRKRKLR